ncbi:MAG: hypothetical protein QXT26_05500 [Thermoproteota archaeon]
MTSVRWVTEKQGNRWIVTGVQLTFDRNLPSGTTIYIDLLNSNNEIKASGSETLESDLPSWNPVTISINTSSPVRANEIARIAISVVEGPSE